MYWGDKMALTKCPKCEINYILDDKQLCKVCLQELKTVGRNDEEGDICPVCGEREVVPGKVYCKQCLLDTKKLNTKRRVRKDISLTDTTLDTIDDEIGVDSEIAVDAEDDDDADEDTTFAPTDDDTDTEDAPFFIDGNGDDAPAENEEDELDGFTTIEELDEDTLEDADDA